MDVFHPGDESRKKDPPELSTPSVLFFFSLMNGHLPGVDRMR